MGDRPKKTRSGEGRTTLIVKCNVIDIYRALFQFTTGQSSLQEASYKNS